MNRSEPLLGPFFFVPTSLLPADGRMSHWFCRPIHERSPGRARSPFMRARNLPSIKRSSFQPRLEALEDRIVPTTTLYLDFGDAFASGGLQKSVEAFAADIGDGGVNGPDLDGEGSLTDATQMSILGLRATMAGLAFDYNGSGGFNTQDYTRLRDDVVALVRRQYEPFDVEVRVAASAGFADVSRFLQSTSGPDAYVFIVGAFLSGTSPPASVGIAAQLYGLASDRDLNDVRNAIERPHNRRDETAVVFAENMLADYLNSDRTSSAASWLANTAAHEAGHTLGLPHTEAWVATESDIMQEGGHGPEQKLNRAFFTRYSFHSADRIPGLETPIFSDLNPYVWLVGDAEHPNIGAKPNYAAYITGTGLNDHIQIIDHGTYAQVLIGGADYSVPKTNGIIIDTGRGADTIFVDASLGCSVKVVGGEANDGLVILGDGRSDGTYTPSRSSTRTL